MKIYVVEESGCEGGTVLGVFKTFDKAEKRIKKYIKKSDNRWLKFGNENKNRGSIYRNNYRWIYKEGTQGNIDLTCEFKQPYRYWSWKNTLNYLTIMEFNL